MVIRVDKNNYFYDCNSNERVEEYDPLNPNLEFVFNNDGCVIHVNNEKIKTTKLGICFDFNGKTHIIDDNHQQVLVYAAYIINQNYDRIKELDINKGVQVKEAISNLIDSTLKEEFSKLCFYNHVSTSLNRYADFRLDLQAEGKICFQTISNLVNTNKLRREFDLPYYPYLRGMDRYNVYYMSVWVTENTGNGEKVGSSEFDSFLEELIAKLNQNNQFNFSARSLNITSKIIRVRDDLVPATI